VLSSGFPCRNLAVELHPAAGDARVGATAYGVMRLTLDDRLVAIATKDLAFGGDASTPIAPDQTILELKYRVEMPAMFKQLAEQFHLVARPVSKYRLAVAALGFVESHA
jgi:hypothetical protein